MLTDMRWHVLPKTLLLNGQFDLPGIFPKRFFQNLILVELKMQRIKGFFLKFNFWSFIESNMLKKGITHNK